MTAQSPWMTRAAAVFVGLVALAAVFADFLASDSPVVLYSGGELYVLPAVTAIMTADEPAARGAREHGSSDGDWAIWPLLVRSGPEPSAARLAAPTATHPLGTDSLGRDVLAMTIHGTRGTAVIAFVVALLAGMLGLIGGGLAGFGSQTTDAVLSRVVEMTGALPTVVLIAIARAADPSPGAASFVAVLVVLESVHVARLVRGEVLRVSGQDFVLAARALGAAPLRVFRYHVLPHAVSPLLVRLALVAAVVVGLDAALGFLGLGPGTSPPSWGALLGDVGSGLPAGAFVGPALCAVTTTLALLVLADAAEDARSARHGRPKPLV